MKIYELDLTEGKKYLADGIEWEVCHNGDLWNDNRATKIVHEYNLSQLLQLDFEEVIDWSQVEVDTPVWVRDYEKYKWQPQHFAKYEDGRIYCWNDGCTSHSSKVSWNVCYWKYASLTNPNEAE